MLAAIDIPADEAASAVVPGLVDAADDESSSAAPQYHCSDDISMIDFELSSTENIDTMLMLIADIRAAVIPVPDDSIFEPLVITVASAAGYIPTADTAPVSRHPVEMFIQSSVSFAPY